MITTDIREQVAEDEYVQQVVDATVYAIQIGVVSIEEFDALRHDPQAHIAIALDYLTAGGRQEPWIEQHVTPDEFGEMVLDVVAEQIEDLGLREDDELEF